jgi:hypothetical protein
MLRHLRLERNGERGGRAHIERYDYRCSRKQCAAIRQSAENTVRVLQRPLCRLVLVGA